jgi:hypothetical protein
MLAACGNTIFANTLVAGEWDSSGRLGEQACGACGGFFAHTEPPGHERVGEVFQKKITW